MCSVGGLEMHYDLYESRHRQLTPLVCKPDDEKPIVSQPSTHQDGRSTQKQSHGGRVIDDDGESSDDGIIRSSKRKISKGRALILADEDDDDDY